MGSSVRGLRLNNPGNIRKSAELFKGEIFSSDNQFKAFSSMAYGYRAMAVILYNYVKKHNLNTIRKIIDRYAPPEDNNNTSAYVSSIASGVGVSPDSRIITENDFRLPIAFMKSVLAEMSNIEVGTVDYPALNEGYQMFVNDRL